MLRKAALAGAVLAMSVLGGPALAGTSTGAGAQKAQLVERSRSNDCRPGTATDSNSAQPSGFVILNSTGQPMSTGGIQGEVSLKNGVPNATYAVNLQSGSNNNCMPQGMLSTNGEGNGNFHISTMEMGSTNHYWVVLKEMMPSMSGAKSEYASASVPLD